MAVTADELLFSYGTLQLPAVQLDTFGRMLRAEADVLPGFTVEYSDIADPRVVTLSGLDAHPIVRRTGNPLDKVIGTVLAITADELEAADEYEIYAYLRIEVLLASGRIAWAYVSP